MIDASLALEISSMLHMLWAYCQVNTEALEIYTDHYIEICAKRWFS